MAAWNDQAALTRFRSWPPPVETRLDSFAPKRPFVSVAVLTALAVGAVVTYLGPVLAPLLLALLLYFMIRPLAEALIRAGIRPWLAYVTLFVAVAVLFFGIARVVHQNVVAFQERLPAYRQNLDRLVYQLIGDEPQPPPLVTRPAATLPTTTSETQPLATTPTELFPDRQEVRKSVLQLFDIGVRDVLNFAWAPAVSFLETGLFVVFYLLFILISAARMPTRVLRAFGDDQAEQILSIGRGIATSISQYVKVKTAVSFGMAAVSAAILWYYGVHYWQLWAFLFFALNYITYIGSLFACVPPIVMAFLQFDSMVTALLISALVAANRLVWVDFVEIRFTGEHLNVDPLLILIAIVYWGWFWGVLGMVLAVPMLVALKIVLGRFESSRKWAIMMSEN